MSKKAINRWTKPELDILRREYPNLGIIGLVRSGLLPNRTLLAIKDKAQREGIRDTNPRSKRPWTEEEDAVLKRYFTRLGVQGIIDRELLPGRTKGAIRGRVYHKQLLYTSDTPGKRRWSTSELKALREHYPRLGAAKMVARGLIENRTAIAIQQYARQKHIRAREPYNLRRLEIDGINASLREHCQRLGISPATVWSRHYTLNWTLEDSLRTPVALPGEKRKNRTRS